MVLNLISNPPPWPGDARCAVAFTFDMDAESLLHLYHREAAPGLIGTSATLRYGPRIAVPRLVEIARHTGIKLTGYVPGWCVETYPDAIAGLVEGGHEIGHHGWLHEKPNTLSREDEERVLLRGIEAIEAATGTRPRGYRAPSYAMSEHTLDLLVEHGFSYDSSLVGDDVPYLVSGARGRLVELPSDYALDDWPQYVHMKEFGCTMPIRSPERALEVFRAEFDAAWTHGGLWVSIFHPFVSGRLARAEALLGLIAYMQEKGGVWFATMAEIAEHIEGLVETGQWHPREERLPFWREPVAPLVTPRES
ncbi:polysaccharide deacetylase [Kaustia mangrovi]|uniref:Chitooligosaccharide deacetylase n=1 Tax=Kaustia mangrovi TaxID=2593653 RepID=A0A7S8HCU9_9HYPH|nr:polysaccharide deacetylase [Kaustia mangrovi]QPC44112.1 polysaccharide deacetylase [Kaustia mangrovi]